jgi:hypothetical protein
MKCNIVDHNKVPVISKYNTFEFKITENKLEVKFMVIYNHANK